MSKKLRVLIVEDMEDDAQLLLRELRRGDYDPVFLRVDRLEAMKNALSKMDWDVIISDYSMPHLDGLTALTVLKESGLDLPFILVSGTVGEDVAVAAMKAGAHDYLIKGNLSRLVPAIERELRESRERQARRQAETALVATTERLQSLLASSPAVIYALKLEEENIVPVWLSDSIATVLGYLVGEALQSEWFFGAIHPEDLPRALDDIPVLVAEGQSSGEFRIRHKNGNYLWFRDNKRLLRDSDGRPSEIVGVWTDITEQKQLEGQLRQAQKMEAVGQLAGGVAHDFNNLLTIIIGYSDFLLEGAGSDEKLRRQVEGIRKAAERASGLTRQLLAFSRKQVLEPKILNLNDVVADVEKMLKRLIGENIELSTDLPRDLGRIKADPGQLEQVIVNLAVNARDAMPDGGKLTIQTGNAELDEKFVREHIGSKSGQYVVLSVADTGCGMNTEVQKRIFEPFFTTKEKGRGTGLGLATVYGIVKQSDGYIAVESAIGRGTTFEVYFPRTEKQPGDPITEKVQLKSSRGTETILLAEDEDDVRLLASQILIENGYMVLEARNGQETIAICERHTGTIHLLITDVVMPKMGGPESAQRLAFLRPEMKMLFVSGYTDNPVVLEKIMSREVAFMQKPFTPESLARKVREVLDAKKKTPQSALEPLNNFKRRGER